MVGCCALCSTAAWTQESPQLEAKLRAEAEASPLIFSFAPKLESTWQQEREEMAQRVARIDSMDLPEARKYKLIRDLYRNRESKRLQKALLAKTHFEEGPGE